MNIQNSTDKQTVATGRSVLGGRALSDVYVIISHSSRGMRSLLEYRAQDHCLSIPLRIILMKIYTVLLQVLLCSSAF